ncbi:two-component system response regulator [Geobacter sp. SVR]|uniref:response regulator n=1 Tax=Geobacter sp. SVR TaxID=2495594 RepID=UPI00143EF640|nr:response regulator [Geobacter sp. SVR]BCS53357.1 hypothetical protein GSVR_16650 [Geobacter sp. SVR]GCF85517.1 hypothetical protein GSbR_21170 [Geobacter sp. SVR]
MNAGTDRSTILIVDDELLSVEMLKNMLMEEYDVIMASTAGQALNIALRTPPDLILMDILMPDMTGYEVCQILKDTPACRDIPILFITILSEAENESYGLAMGAADFIIKPFNPTLVRLRVKNHLELKHQRDMLVSRAAELQRVNLDLANEIAERQRVQEDHELLIRELREATANVKALSRLLPICSSCRKVRDDKGYWNQLEHFITEHTEIEFSHGLCVECAKTLYPEFCDRIPLS